jgi:hypothetical protein
MKIAAKVASALSFAHLAGIGRKASAAQDDDKDKPERDHEDGDVKKGKKAEGDDPKEDDQDKKDDPKLKTTTTTPALNPETRTKAKTTRSPRKPRPNPTTIRKTMTTTKRCAAIPQPLLLDVVSRHVALPSSLPIMQLAIQSWPRISHSRPG